MQVIILNQFFYPDHSATSLLMTDLAGNLAARGIDVTALAGRGRYTGGETLPAREDYRGVRIERAWATSFGKKNIAARMADYLSFYVGASWKLLRLPRHDIVMALTTPPLINLVALFIGRLRGMRVVALIQDVYPDVAVALGTLAPRSPVTRFLDQLDRVALRGADRIVVLGECMRERIIAKIGHAAASRIDVIHNWDDRGIEPLGDEENWFSVEHNLQDKFVLLFAGNFGRVNEFSTVLEAARRLRDCSDIVFLFVGDGVQAGEIKEFAEQHQLANVRMLPYQSPHLMRYVLAAGDASLVTLANGLAGLSVPSKTYGILAAARPILFVGDERSDIARLVAENDCGAVVAAGDDERLASVISEWAGDRARVAELGAAARETFEKRFNRAHAVEAYMEMFTRCLDAPTPRAGASVEHAKGEAAKLNESKS